MWVTLPVCSGDEQHELGHCAGLPVDSGGRVFVIGVVSEEEFNPYEASAQGEEEFFRGRLGLTDAKLRVVGVSRIRRVCLTSQYLHIGKQAFLLRDIVWWSELFSKGLVFKRYGILLYIDIGNGLVQPFYLTAYSVSGIQSPKKLKALLAALPRAGARKSAIEPERQQQLSWIQSVQHLFSLPFNARLTWPCRMFFTAASLVLFSPVFLLVYVLIQTRGQIVIVGFAGLFILFVVSLVFPIYWWLLWKLAGLLFPTQVSAMQPERR